MLAHDLALWLLRGPNEEVLFEVGHSTIPFEQLAEEYGKDAARGLDTEGLLYDTVMDIQLKGSFGFRRVIKIGYEDIWKEDIRKEQDEEMQKLDGPPGGGEWGTSDGRVNEILLNILEVDAQ